MKDIAIIIPLHKIDPTILPYVKNAVDNVNKCQAKYTEGNLSPYIVGSKEVVGSELVKGIDGVQFIKNDGETDFCSQVNFAADKIDEDYFSILEFDDEYSEKWFSMVKDYYYSNEDVSLFLPVNIQISTKQGFRQFNNEYLLSKDTVDEIGFVTKDDLRSFMSINVTGGVFNRADFIKIGKYKPSIQIFFNYELLLRMVNKGLKVYVVPKEGYKHVIDRDDSLTDYYLKNMSEEEVRKWYVAATKEYEYLGNRSMTISDKKQ